MANDSKATNGPASLNQFEIIDLADAEREDGRGRRVDPLAVLKVGLRTSTPSRCGASMLGLFLRRECSLLVFRIVVLSLLTWTHFAWARLDCDDLPSPSDYHLKEATTIVDAFIPETNPSRSEINENLVALRLLNAQFSRKDWNNIIALACVRLNESNALTSDDRISLLSSLQSGARYAIPDSSDIAASQTILQYSLNLQDALKGSLVGGLIPKSQIEAVSSEIENKTRKEKIDPAILKPNYAVETVYFGTDRKVAHEVNAINPQFSTERVSQITYGKVDVSIPHNHLVGALESQKWWKLEFRPDPDKHVVILGLTILDHATFISSIQTKLQDSSGNSVLVFIHGFNVGFEDAARRTAQMAYDLRFKGVPIFFAWPSQDNLVSYTVDEQQIVDATPHIESFLRNILAESGAKNVYVIAHSMGSRGLTHALVDLNETDPKDAKRIKAIILAAPDIGATEFTEQIAPRLSKMTAPITLYASSNDRALTMSMELHGGPRAGESGDHIVVADGIDTIDASNTTTDFLGHSYFADRSSVLADMWYLINDGLRANQRCCLRPDPATGKPRYWVFLK